MHVGGIAWSYEDSGICDAPSNGSRRDAAARDAATRALEANGEAMKELWVVILLVILLFLILPKLYILFRAVLVPIL